MAGKTLDELEGVVWGEPTYDSYLVRTCHRLRTKPVDEFTVEDLRIMIGQEIGLPHLVPRAVAVLEREPLAEGDFYPGDLLASVLGAAEWLRSQPDWFGRVLRVAERAVAELGEADSGLRAKFAALLWRVRAEPGASDQLREWVGPAGVSERRQVVLASFPPERKLEVIVMVQKVTGLSLSEAKTLVQSDHGIIKKDLIPEEAEQLARCFQGIAAVSVEPVDGR